MKTYTTLLLVAVLLLSACAAPTISAQPLATSTIVAAVQGSAALDPATALTVMPSIPVETVVPKSSSDVVPPDTDLANKNANGHVAANETAQNDWPGTGELTAVEAQGLLYMREEEKLARDIYLTLYEKWHMPVFQNIAGSEQTHMEAIRTLLDRYGLQDPAAGRDVGSFADETLQELYDQLSIQGSQSLVDALRVGAAIEEIDILYLDEYLVQTDKADIQLVYQNLGKGSRNHLRSFVTNLQRRDDKPYQPQYLDQETYDQIISTDMERGSGKGRNG